MKGALSIMKKRYTKPMLVNSVLQKNAIPAIAGLPGIAGFVAGYAAVKGVTSAMEATPMKKLNNLQIQKW